MTDRTKYRVDRANSHIVPCGMNSILYIGSNWAEARRVFDKADTGLNAWNQPAPTYGVILSVWDGSDYVAKCTKGI